MKIEGPGSRNYQEDNTFGFYSRRMRVQGHSGTRILKTILQTYEKDVTDVTDISSYSRIFS
jgi:hypothetical protein